MKHSFRFFARFEKIDSHYEWLIEGEEFHHLHTVLRLKEGDEVDVFNGLGSSAKAIIKQIQNKKCALAESPSIKKEKQGKNRLGLAIASLKKQTMEDLLPCLTELGVDDIHIFAQEKTPKFLLAEKSLERYKKIVLSSSKQAKRNFIPKVRFWQNHEEMTKHLAEKYDDLALLSLDAEERLIDFAEDNKSTCAIIGSEAGLTTEEEKCFVSHGAEKVTLGANTLRAFTAAISAATLLKFDTPHG